MTGGLLQLVAIGVDNLYLIGDPQITLFKIVYRRHSNFSIYTSTLRPIGSSDAGDEFIINLEPKGDILHKMDLVMDVPRVNIAFSTPTLQLIQNILSNYGIKWINNNSGTTIVTLDNYNSGYSHDNNSILNAINDQIQSYVRSYDYYNMATARLNYFEKITAVQFLDYIGTGYLTNNIRTLFIEAFDIIGTDYLIKHLTKFPTADHTNPATYTDLASYIDLLNDHTIKDIIAEYLETVIMVFASYVEFHPLDINQKTIYVNTFFNSSPSTINVIMNQILINSNGNVLTHLINDNLDTNISRYVTTYFSNLVGIVESFLRTLTIGFITQFSNQINDKIIDIRWLVAQYYALYYAPNSTNIYHLLDNYGLYSGENSSILYQYQQKNLDEENSSFLYQYQQEILYGNTIKTVTSYMAFNNIIIDQIISFIYPYLTNLRSMYNTYVLKHKSTSLNNLTKEYLLWYIDQNVNTNIATTSTYLAVIDSWLLTFNINNLSMKLNLRDYLLALTLNYVSYLQLSTATSDSINTYISSRDIIIVGLQNEIITDQTYIMAMIMLNNRIEFRKIAITFLNLWIDDMELTSLEYTESISSTLSYYSFTVRQYLTTVKILFDEYMTLHSITIPDINDVTNFVSDNSDLENIENNVTLSLYIDEQRIDITLMQNLYTSIVYQERQIFDLIRFHSIAYLNAYVTNNKIYSVYQYILDNLNNDKSFNNYIAIFLDEMVAKFNIYIGTTIPTLPIVNEFFNVETDTVNELHELHFDKQRTIILGIAENSLNKLSNFALNSLVTKALANTSMNELPITTGRNITPTLFSALLKMNSFTDNFLDPTDTDLPTLINNTIFADNTFFASLADNHAYEIIYNGLIALYNDTNTTFDQSSLSLKNGDFIRIAIYNYYLDHILKNYVDANTIQTFDQTGLITDYVYPNPKFLETQPGTIENVFDPLYTCVKENLTVYHIIDKSDYAIQQDQYGSSTQLFMEKLIQSAYTNYINVELLSLHRNSLNNAYSSTDAYITYKKYINILDPLLTTVTSTNNIYGVSLQLIDNIHWNNLLNFDQVKKILGVLRSGVYGDDSHYRIGLFKKYTQASNIFTATSNIFSTIAESIYADLSDNLLAPLISSSIANVPDGVTNFFKDTVVATMRKFIPDCQKVLQLTQYTSYLNNFASWKNLLINTRSGSILAKRLAQTNPTITGETPDYSVFTTDYAKIALLNFVPYLAVRDIPLMLRDVLKTTTFSFIPKDNISDSLYDRFIKYFNMVDGDENESSIFEGPDEDKLLKLYLYKTIAESIMVIVNGSTATVNDHVYFKKMRTIYAPNAEDYLTTVMFRPEGLFPYRSNIIINDSLEYEIDDEGETSYLPIEWICNTYITRFENKVETFVTDNFSDVSSELQLTYIATLKDVMNNVVKSFNRYDLPSYNVYTNNDYTLYNIDNGLSGFSNGTIVYCDAMSTIWNQIQRSYIQLYNSTINDILLSRQYYQTSLGTMMTQIYTKVQTQFVNVAKMFITEPTNPTVKVNFDTMGRTFLQGAGTTVLNSRIGELLTTQLSLPSEATTQYEILVWQYLSALTTMYKEKFKSLLILSPSTSDPNQIDYMINQFFVQQRDEITNLQIKITSQNINLLHFGRNFLRTYAMTDELLIITGNTISITNDIYRNVFSDYTNADTTITTYGYYISAYCRSILNLFAIKMITQISSAKDNIITIETIVSQFYKENYDAIIALGKISDESTGNLDISIAESENYGFEMSSIKLLNTVYTYYTVNTNPHYDSYSTDKKSFVPVLGDGYDFYKLRIQTTNPNIPSYTTLITYADDLSKYYTTIQKNYTQYKGILDMRKDYNNIKIYVPPAGMGIKMKKNYFYDTANNVVTWFAYHTEAVYVTPLYTTDNPIRTYLANIILDTKTTLLSKYVGVYDVILSQVDGTEPIIPNTHIRSVDDIFKKTESATENPYDQTIFPNLYAWYETYVDDPDTPMNTIYTMYSTIMRSITSASLYNDKNIIKLYNSFLTYQDVLLYIADQVIKKTPLAFMLDTIDTSVSATFASFKTALTSRTEKYLSSILKITPYSPDKYSKQVNIVPQTGFAYKFLTSILNTVIDPTTGSYIDINKITNLDTFPTADLYGYIPSTGVPHLKTDLETALLKTITHATPTFAWVKELGHKLLESVTINIGGEDIETHTSELYSLLHKIYDNVEHNRGYNILIGNTEEMYTESTEQRSITKLIIPMRFWFNRHAGSGLPLLSMLYSKAILKIKLSELNQILFTEESSHFVRKPKFKCKAYAQYVYLDDDERIKMANAKMEYLIERFVNTGQTNIIKKDILKSNLTANLQVSDVVAQDIASPYGISIPIPINALNDPTKYLLWTVKFNDPTKIYSRNILNWTRNGYYTTDSTGKTEHIYPAFNKMKIKFNGRDRETYKEEIYYTHVTPWSRHMGSLDEGEYVYSFALYPLLLQPSCSANFSQIEDALIMFQPSQKVIDKIINYNVSASINIWGCTTTIFRVMSGMAAPLFYG